MKTKTFFLICLLSSIGLTQLSAQGDQKGSDTRSYSFRGELPYWFPVYCDGVQIDYLSAIVDAHGVEHFVNGVPVWAQAHIKDDIISESGEVFKLHEINKLYFPDPYVYICSQTNLIGNNGSHYIAKQTWYLDGTYTIDKALCLDNGRK
jgi:hypothetical protein